MKASLAAMLGYSWYDSAEHCPNSEDFVSFRQPGPHSAGSPLSDPSLAILSAEHSKPAHIRRIGTTNPGRRKKSA